MESRPHRRSRELKAVPCSNPACSAFGCLYSCGACNITNYCSIACQLQDWPSHCCRTNDSDSDSDLDPVTRCVTQWLRANIRIRKCTRDPTITDMLHRFGYIGSGRDAHVMGTIVGRQAMALKLSLIESDADFAHAMGEIDLHRLLYQHTKGAPGQRRVAAVVALYAHWSITCSLTQLLLSMHPGGQIPTFEEQALVGLMTERLHLDMRRKQRLIGAHLEFMPKSVGDLWTSRATLDEQMNNIYAQIVGCLGVLQPAGLTHRDVHADNLRLIGCGARQIVFKMPSGAFYALPLLATILPDSGINGTRAVLCDFGRATAIDSTANRGCAYGPKFSADALHSSETGNPGYDLWLLAVDIVVNTLPGCQPPSIVCALIPDKNKITSLLAHLSQHRIDRSYAQALETMRDAADTWINVDQWDSVRSLVTVDELSGNYHYRIQWPSEFYVPPEEALRRFGLAPTSAPLETSVDTVLVAWD